MSSGQEFNNRSQGQRLRRLAERQDRLEAASTANAAQTAQAQRDIKMTQARVTAVEQANKRQPR